VSVEYALPLVGYRLVTTGQLGQSLFFLHAKRNKNKATATVIRKCFFIILCTYRILFPGNLPDGMSASIRNVNIASRIGADTHRECELCHTCFTVGNACRTTGKRGDHTCRGNPLNFPITHVAQKNVSIIIETMRYGKSKRCLCSGSVCVAL